MPGVVELRALHQVLCWAYAERCATKHEPWSVEVSSVERDECDVAMCVEKLPEVLEHHAFRTAIPCSTRWQLHMPYWLVIGHGRINRVRNTLCCPCIAFARHHLHADADDLPGERTESKLTDALVAILIGCDTTQEVVLLCIIKRVKGESDRFKIKHEIRRFHGYSLG